jgi:uncharacterized protein
MNGRSTKRRLFGGALLLAVGSLWMFSDRVTAAPASVKLVAGGEVIDAQIARSDEELGLGLSGATALGENEGLLFVLPKGGKSKFHMKAVTLPLSIAYLDQRGRILKLEDMDPKAPGRMYEAPDQTRFALEMNQGWFERHGLREGDRIRRKS